MERVYIFGISIAVLILVMTALALYEHYFRRKARVIPIDRAETKFTIQHFNSQLDKLSDPPTMVTPEPPMPGAWMDQHKWDATDWETFQSAQAEQLELEMKTKGVDPDGISNQGW